MNNELSEYRLKDAKEKLEAAIILLKNKKYKDSVSRSYYAMFSAVKALLATKNMDSSKHSGVISLFNLHFVKEGIVEKECGKLIAKAKDIREEGDYGDFIVVSEEEAELQISNAQKILSEVERVLRNTQK
jgi:uncharacterized protein (UPF0332 family)